MLCFFASVTQLLATVSLLAERGLCEDRSSFSVAVLTVVWPGAHLPPHVQSAGDRSLVMRPRVRRLLGFGVLIGWQRWGRGHITGEGYPCFQVLFAANLSLVALFRVRHRMPSASDASTSHCSAATTCMLLTAQPRVPDSLPGRSHGAVRLRTGGILAIGTHRMKRQ